MKGFSQIKDHGEEKSQDNMKKTMQNAMKNNERKHNMDMVIISRAS